MCFGMYSSEGGDNFPGLSFFLQTINLNTLKCIHVLVINSYTISNILLPDLDSVLLNLSQFCKSIKSGNLSSGVAYSYHRKETY